MSSDQISQNEKAPEEPPVEENEKTEVPDEVAEGTPNPESSPDTEPPVESHDENLGAGEDPMNESPMMEETEPIDQSNIMSKESIQMSVGSTHTVQDDDRSRSLMVSADRQPSVSISLKTFEEESPMKSALSLGKRRRTISDGAQRKSLMTSRARLALGSIISIRRSSALGEYYDKRAARYMNTYKLDSDNPFKPEKVQQILENVMTEALENLTYDPDKCPKQAKWACGAIRAKIKELDFDRYKLICVVTIGEKNSQDVLATCRFLWDSDKDRYAVFATENTYVFGIAQCFALYYE